MSIEILVQPKKEINESGTKICYLHDKDYTNERNSKRRRLEERAPPRPRLRLPRPRLRSPRRGPKNKFERCPLQ